MKKIFSLLIAIMFGVYSFAQPQTGPDSTQLAALLNLQLKMQNNIGVNWNEHTGTPDVITLSKSYSFASDPIISAKLFFKEIKNLLKKKDIEDDLIIERTTQLDSIKHLRFKQYYKGIPVNGGEYVITVLPNGKIKSALGSFYKNINVNVTPILSLQDAYNVAKLNVPPNIVFKDTLEFSELIIYPQNGEHFLAWQLEIPTTQDGENWRYVIDASGGLVLNSQSLMINELSTLLVPQSQANIFMRHPYLDPNYTYISPIYDNGTGYLQGAYANILNDATSRAYSSTFNFAYSTGDTHFDEANLFYHIDKFRRNFWNSLGFNEFTQITAHAHTYFSGGPNASYSPSDHHLRFSDGQGVYGYNSFAREDKIVYHEYVHAVTDYVAQLYYANTESGAIHEGNSDYYAGSFTNRSLQGEYISPVYAINQRDMTSPRIINYTQYNDPNLSYWIQYGYHEPHFGGELWSAVLWDLRRSDTGIGSYYADRLIYSGLNAIPTNSSFLQYRQAIIDADINNYNGTHANTIRHVFYLRGIGPDYMNFNITGPSYLMFKSKGTYNANITGGSGSVSYVWYKKISGQWQQISTSSSITLTMVYDNIEIKLDLHDNVTGENVSKTKIIYYDDGLPKKVVQGKDLPTEFKVEQNYPNPFNPTTQINYSIKEAGLVQLKIYDILGKEIATLVNENKEAGNYSVDFNAIELPSGVYIYQLTTSGFTQARKMILAK